MANLDSVLKSRDITLPVKVHIIKAMFCFVFFGSHTQLWELGCKEGWAPRNWRFWSVVLEKTLESPLASREIKPVHPRDQSWIFIERTDAEAAIFGQLMWRANSLEKTLMLGKTEGRRRRGSKGWDCWMPSPTQWKNLSLNKLWGTVKDRKACCCSLWVAKSQTQLSD